MIIYLPSLVCLNVTALLVSTPFVVWNVRDNLLFQYALRPSAVTGILHCVRLLIALFGREVCNVIIMLQFVIEAYILFLLRCNNNFSEIFEHRCP